MRIDKRAYDELRPVSFTKNYIESAEGSVLVQMGKTRVLCITTLEERVPQFLKNSEQGWLTAEYSMLPRATPVRTSRESSLGRPQGRTQEIQRLIGRSLRAVTDLKALRQRTLTVDCDVIEADGGTRTASITGAFLSLALTVDFYLKNGVLETNPIRDYVAAVSTGVVEGEALLDLCYKEDFAADVDMNIVMTGSGEFIELQGTAEKSPFGESLLMEMLSLGRKGINELIEMQKIQIE